MDKEIEELLNKIKNSIKKHKEEDFQDDMLVILELDVIQWNLLLSYIEQLENNRDKAIEMLETYKRMLSLYSQRVNIFDLQDVIDELKGDSD